MGNLYIIATSHEDFTHGPGKLLRLYEEIKPDILLSEMSEQDFRKFQEICARFDQQLRTVSDDNEGIDSFMALLRDSVGYERRVNQEYADRYGVPHFMIDMPGGQSKMLQEAEETIDEVISDARAKGGIDIGHWIGRMNELGEIGTQNAHKFWEFIQRYEGTPQIERIVQYGRERGRIGEPEKYMEQRIRKLYDPNKIIAFPVGMFHTINNPSGNTLYPSIKDLNPERIPLL